MSKQYKLVVEAESKEAALAHLKTMTPEEWDRPAGPGGYYLETVEEEVDWRKEAAEYVDDIIADNWGEWEPEVKEATGTARDRYDDVVYQGADLISICHEWIDTALIHNSIQDNADLIDALDEWEETATGLWEGVSDADEIIAAKAFWTLRAAVASMAEEKLLEKIAEVIGTDDPDEEPEEAEEDAEEE